MPPTREKPANGNGNGQHCQGEETQSQCLDDGIAAEELDALTLAEGADSDSESAAGPGAEDVADYLAELESLGNPDVMETFAKLGLCHEVCATVRDMKWNYPLSVQEESIVHLLNGEDVMITGRSGSGTTSGCILAVLQLIINDIDAAQKAQIPFVSSSFPGPFALMMASSDESAERTLKEIQRWTDRLVTHARILS